MLSCYTYAAQNFVPLLFDDGHGDYNRSYERDYDDRPPRQQLPQL